MSNKGRADRELLDRERVHVGAITWLFAFDSPAETDVTSTWSILTESDLVTFFLMLCGMYSYERARHPDDRFGRLREEAS